MMLHLKQTKRELCGTLSSLLKAKFTLGIEVDDFIKISSELIQPLEYFFQSNICDGGRWNN
ncbi:Uncharacterized protein TCM_005240 [Theobroma cacao]|uniref:Uncharacterized protein n=1 Tax=Theobroma cacao TaxID=3641 RepID=A0A061DSY6_THECC|nr:Uncharacterized protein TCM_005240 [Theobroma cacao]